MRLSQKFKLPMLLCSLLLVSCGNGVDKPYAEIADKEVRPILKMAITKAGGLDTWQHIKTISYTKRSRLFLEDGTVESDRIQHHTYTMQPEFSVRIWWHEEGRRHEIDYSPWRVIKKTDGKRDESVDTTALKQNVMSGLYTLGMPFKLLDEGTSHNYEGTTSLKSGEEADVIKATYRPAEHQNHSTSDVWWYYFDHQNGRYLAAMVYHRPTYAYIQNLAFHTDLPVKLFRHRKSYRVDSLRNVQFLRAEFWYTDFKIEMAEANTD